MNILVFGRGAIGSQYGWALENAGNNVDFFVRKGRINDYGNIVNLDVYDSRIKKQVNTRWQITMKDTIEEDSNYDLIIMSVNPEQVSSAVDTIKQFVKNSTVLFLCNYGLNPKDAISGIPVEQVVFGFPGAGGGYEGNNLSGIMYKSIQIGQTQNKPSSRERDVINLFKTAGFNVSIQKNIEEWLLNHFVLNTAMEAMVLERGSFKAVASSKEALTGMILNVKELIPYVDSKGYKPDSLLKAIKVLPPNLIASLMKNLVYKENSAAYNAIAHNHYKAGYAVMQVAKDAKQLGIVTPRLDKALQNYKG